jgi:hypothetical protein
MIVYNTKDKIAVCNMDQIEMDLNDNLVEVDELMANVIVDLNKRGYKTRFCCSSHDFPTADGYTLNGEIKYHYEYSPGDIYILFDKVYDIPKLPEGWFYEIMPSCVDVSERLSIRHNDSVNHYEYLIWLVNKMKILDEWVLKLPDLTE